MNIFTDHHSHRGGLAAASKRSMEHLLSVEKGQATILVPGGTHEAVNSNEGVIRLYLQRRKGFIKLALRFGRALVPVFAFGETDVYDQVLPNPRHL